MMNEQAEQVSKKCKDVGFGSRVANTANYNITFYEITRI